MISLERPVKPADFDKKVSGLSWPSGPSPATGKKRKSKEVWGDYKVVFSNAQFQKCAFCERDCISTGDGDVDHYAPKGEVSELDSDPKNWGQEDPSRGSIKGRKTTKISEVGYHWLAYDWDNFLLVCSKCNRRWKKALFPVGNAPRTLPPESGSSETCLLLNPFDLRDIHRLFSFDEFGAISPRNSDPRANWTIGVCGLHRTSLTFRRQKFASKTFEQVRLTLKALAEGSSSISDNVKLLLAMGAPDVEHAGLVRSIWESESGLAWQQLVDFAS